MTSYQKPNFDTFRDVEKIVSLESVCHVVIDDDHFGRRATGNHVSQQNVDYGCFENEILEVIRKVQNLSHVH